MQFIIDLFIELKKINLGFTHEIEHNKTIKNNDKINKKIY